MRIKEKLDEVRGEILENFEGVMSSLSHFLSDNFEAFLEFKTEVKGDDILISYGEYKSRKFKILTLLDDKIILKKVISVVPRLYTDIREVLQENLNTLTFAEAEECTFPNRVYFMNSKPIQKFIRLIGESTRLIGEIKLDSGMEELVYGEVTPEDLLLHYELGIFVGEYDIEGCKTLIDKYGFELIKEFLSHFGYLNSTDPVEIFESVFRGQFNSNEEFAYHILEELEDLPAHLIPYFDISKYSSDMLESGYFNIDSYYFQDQ